MVLDQTAVQDSGIHLQRCQNHSQRNQVRKARIMAIRYIKDDGHYFYIVTEKGQVAFRVKDHARLLNTTDKTWTIERYGWVYTYDENNNLIEQRHA